MQSKQEINRQNIVHKYLENSELPASTIAKTLNLSKRTCQEVIKKYKQTLTITRSSGSGRKPGPANKILAEKIKRSFKYSPGLSVRDRAQRYGISKTNVHKLCSKSGFKSFKAIKQPNRNDIQNQKAKIRSRKLYDEVLTVQGGCIMMDDETYVKCDFKQLPGQKFYVSKIRGNVPKKFKYVLQDKFAKKLMIWQAICSCGLKSKGFVTNRTMNGSLYIEECLEKRLMPFIRAHNLPVKFWPDLASCHYARVTMDWYQTNGVDVVAKNQNPPNCPEFRPIEKYWAIVKRKLKKSGATALDAKKMIQKWNLHGDSVTVSTVRNLMGSINSDVRKFIRQ